MRNNNSIEYRLFNIIIELLKTPKRDIITIETNKYIINIHFFPFNIYKWDNLFYINQYLNMTKDKYSKEELLLAAKLQLLEEKQKEPIIYTPEEINYINEVRKLQETQSDGESSTPSS